MLLIVLHLGASAALQSNEVCAYPDEDHSCPYRPLERKSILIIKAPILVLIFILVNSMN